MVAEWNFCSQTSNIGCWFSFVCRIVYSDRTRLLVPVYVSFDRTVCENKCFLRAAPPGPQLRPHPFIKIWQSLWLQCKSFVSCKTNEVFFKLKTLRIAIQVFFHCIELFCWFCGPVTYFSLQWGPLNKKVGHPCSSPCINRLSRLS